MTTTTMKYTRPILYQTAQTTANKENTKNNRSQTMDANNYRGASNAWAPISYPSTSIFEKFANYSGMRTIINHDCYSRGRQVGLRKPERIPNPYFPLHRDVLLATMRELLIMGGILDHRTLEVADLKSWSPPNKNLDSTNQTSYVSNLTAKKRKVDTAKGVDNSFRKNRCAGVGIIVANPLHVNQIASQPHIVPRSDEDEGNNDDFDFSKFRSSEELVMYAVRQAITISNPCFDRIKSVTDHEETKTSSSAPTRKVSNVDTFCDIPEDIWRSQK